MSLVPRLYDYISVCPFERQDCQFLTESRIVTHIYTKYTSIYPPTPDPMIKRRRTKRTNGNIGPPIPGIAFNIYTR